MNYLLDTNVISELISKRPHQSVLHWIDAQDPNTLYLSAITIGKLQKGIARLTDPSRAAILHEWLVGDLLIRFQSHIFTLDVPVMLVWGDLVGQLAQRGRPIPAFDSLIVALALYHRCALVTRNEADFPDTGVAIVNPWSL